MRQTHTHTHTEAETQAEQEAGAIQEPDVGLDPGSPGSRPELKAALNCWATGAALEFKIKRA